MPSALCTQHVLSFCRRLSSTVCCQRLPRLWDCSDLHSSSCSTANRPRCTTWSCPSAVASQGLRLPRPQDTALFRVTALLAAMQQTRRLSMAHHQDTAQFPILQQTWLVRRLVGHCTHRARALLMMLQHKGWFGNMMSCSRTQGRAQPSALQQIDVFSSPMDHSRRLQETIMHQRQQCSSRLWW